MLWSQTRAVRTAAKISNTSFHLPEESSLKAFENPEIIISHSAGVVITAKRKGS